MNRTNQMLTGIALSTVVLSASVHASDITIQWGHYLPNGPFVEVEKEFVQRVEERSEGRVKFNLAYAGGLGAGEELLPLVGRGAIDMAAIVPGYFPDQLLYSKALQIPFIFDSAEEAIKVAQASYSSMPAFQEEMDKLRVHYLFQQPLGSYYMTGPTDDCKTLEGLAGKKIRTFGADIPEMMKAVDAVPLSVPINDLYESLERGILDYTFLDLGNLEAYRVYEPGPFTCGPAMTMAGHMVVMGQRTWDRLPEDIQKIFTEEAQATQERYLEWLSDANQEARNNIQAAGGQIIELSDEQRAEWKAVTPDLLERWVDSLEERGEGEKAAEVAAQWRELTAD